MGRSHRDLLHTPSLPPCEPLCTTKGPRYRARRSIELDQKLRHISPTFSYTRTYDSLYKKTAPNMMPNVHTRLQAFTIHLAFSFVLFIILSGLILLRWYPDEHWYLGGLTGVAIVAAVDFILGPTLTLVVYKEHKKSLKLDLLCILAVQLSALTYGAWSINQGRPIIQVLTHEGIHIVTKTEVRHFGIEMDQVRKITSDVPARVFMDLPEDTATLTQAIFLSEYIDERPIYMRSDLYFGFPPSKEEHRNMLKRQHPLEGGCLRVKLISHHHNTKSACVYLESGSVELDNRNT